MLSRHTPNGDSASVALLEATSLLTTTSNRSESSRQLPPAFNKQTSPGAARGQFERRLRQVLHEQYQDLMLHLPPTMQARFPRLYRHSQKTFAFTLGMLRLLNVSEAEQTTIALGAFLHDIGKLVIDEAVLNKSGQLTPQEYALIKCHPAFGADILTNYVWLPDVAILAYHHHERWDGEGYPARLAGEAIPLGARIIAIADAFDAMTSHRSYQKRRSPREAIEELERCAGTQFDPMLVQLFCADRLMLARPAPVAPPCPVNH
jgi:HD-GYP domain-containing protein (c-di-GMP phosphodiesterase class II)